MANLRALEANVIDAVAAISPWLAPAIPAYLTAHHAAKYLTFGDSWLDAAFVTVTALAVETVGLSAVHTAMELWTWNEGKSKTEAEAPLAVAILAGAFYIGVVISVNTVLDLFAVTPPPMSVLIANGLLSLLSVNAGVIVALRAQHARRVLEKRDARLQARDERAAKRAAKGAVSKPVAGKLPPLPPLPNSWRKLSAEQKATLTGLSTKQIQALGIPERTARKWAEYQRNGK